MTKTEFYFLCEERSIYPGVALENEELVQALKDGNRDEVKRILEEEF